MDELGKIGFVSTALIVVEVFICMLFVGVDDSEAHSLSQLLW